MIVARGYSANAGAQMLGVWCGFGFWFLFFLASWPMSGFIPPPDPLLSGQELMAKYLENLFWIKASMPVGQIAGILAIPFSATVAIQLARLEYGRIPFYSMASFGLGVANGIVFSLPFIFWAGGYYRPDRAPELVQLISDMTWLEYLMAWAPLVGQMLCIAAVGLQYRGEDSFLIPRWFCWLSIWISVLILPATLCIFFFDGPFAWNGVITWWIPALTFAAYWLVLLWIMRRAVIDHGMKAA